MTGFKKIALFSLSVVGGASAAPEKRQAGATKYCPGDTSICYSEYTIVSSQIKFRVAVPEVEKAPFDVLLQIVAPKTAAGWAGIAWGGKMSSNPLTVAWPNGDSAVVSSRYTTYDPLSGPKTRETFADRAPPTVVALCQERTQAQPTRFCRQQTPMRPIGSWTSSAQVALNGPAASSIQTA